MRRAAGEGTVYLNSRAKGPGTKYRGKYPALGIEVYGSTKTETKTKLDEAIKRAKGAPRVPGRQKTVGDVLNLWLAEGLNTHRYKGTEVASSTRANHEWAIDRLLAVELESGPLVKIKLTELRPSQVSEALAVICRQPLDKRRPRNAPNQPKTATDKKPPKNLGEEALKRIRSVLSLALDYAIAEKDWTGSNVAKSARIPVDATPKGRRDVLAYEDVVRLGEALRQHDDGALWYLMLRAGLRPSEAYGLSVDSYNGSEVNIWQSARRVFEWVENEDGTRRRRHRYAIVDELKNSHSRRTITLPADVVEVLDAHLAREASRIRAARDRGELPLIFGTADNRVPDQKRNRDRFRAICAELGIKNTVDKLPTPYELRHTTATVLMDKEALGDKAATAQEVADILGHKDTRMVHDRYRHKDPKKPRSTLRDSDWLNAS
jgi:integrase